ncbi:hypothetical protein SAMN05421840_10679 [Shewanella morhuae]|nr:hypothetical protein SAMN05421840_10679 [Shewanella morhuae]
MIRRIVIRIQEFCSDLMGPVLVGVMVGWVTFGLIFILKSTNKLDYGLVTNMVIACATIVAVLVHISGLNAQERARSWEIRKNLIFDLLLNISEVLNLNDKFMNLHFSLERTDDYDDYDDYDEKAISALKFEAKNVGSKWRQCKESMNNHMFTLKNVYKPILPNEVIELIGQLESNMDELSREARQEWAEFEYLVEAERQMLNELRTKLFEFVESASGLK